jgi:hypothetical protein
MTGNNNLKAFKEMYHSFLGRKEEHCQERFGIIGGSVYI